jgi:2-aminoethylphosphonate-pyruvate transaminase
MRHTLHPHNRRQPPPTHASEGLATLDAVRRTLVGLAVGDATRKGAFTSVFLQGSRIACVEAAIGTAVPTHGRLLVLVNGVQGARMAAIARRLSIRLTVHDSGELAPPDLERLERTLARCPDVTHVAVAHCEAATGMLNPVAEIGAVCRRYERSLIVDASSTFGGIPLDVAEAGIDFLVGSADECLRGGFGLGFVIARREALVGAAHQARSHALDLHALWRAQEDGQEDHPEPLPEEVLRAFARALDELHTEGGVAGRYGVYRTVQRAVVSGLRQLGFRSLLPEDRQSPTHAVLLGSEYASDGFDELREAARSRGFRLRTGRVNGHDTFRIRPVGRVAPGDVDHLMASFAAARVRTAPRAVLLTR